MSTSKDNYENDIMRTRAGWVLGQLEGPRTEERQGQWRTRTRGERRTRTEQDKGQEEKNDGRRTNKGR
jgi:hypothetical protein